MKQSLLFTALVLSLTLFSGCTQQSEIDQSKICMYSNNDEAKKCKAGELAMFSPQVWGSEQLPLNVAAVYCDFNHEVMYTNAGVICVFTDKRLSLLSGK